MSSNSWVVWKKVDDKTLELACHFPDAEDEGIKFLELPKQKIVFKVEERLSLDDLGSTPGAFELNCYSQGEASFLLAVFHDQSKAEEAKGFAQRKLIEFVSNGYRAIDSSSLEDRGEQENSDQKGGGGSNKEHRLSETTKGPSISSANPDERESGAKEAGTSDGGSGVRNSKLRSALLALGVVVLVTFFTLYSTVENFSTWAKAMIIGSGEDIVLEQEIDVSTIADIDQGFFVELVKAEAIEHFKAEGQEAIDIRKKISTLFGGESKDWAGLEDTIAFGDPEAKDVFYIFADPVCPACQALEAEILSYKENKLNYRIVPVSARGASITDIDNIMCSADPKLAWEKSLKGEEIDRVDLSSCEKTGSALRNRQVFDALGMNSTPTIWMPGNNRIIKDGVPTAAELWKQSQAAPL